MAVPTPTPGVRVRASVLLTRWRRARRVALVAATLLAATVLLGHTRLLGFRGDDWASFDGKRFHVTTVPAGDTLIVRPAAGGEDVRVRLAGVAAPEAGGYWAAESARYLAGRADGKEVTLRLEPTQSRAADGALLATVFLGDANVLNLDVVREGHAYAERREGLSRLSHHAQIEQAEGEARHKKAGLWRNVTEADVPQWRRQWLEGQRAKHPERAVGPRRGRRGRGNDTLRENAVRRVAYAVVTAVVTGSDHAGGSVTRGPFPGAYDAPSYPSRGTTRAAPSAGPLRRQHGGPSLRDVPGPGTPSGDSGFRRPYRVPSLRGRL